MTRFFAGLFFISLLFSGICQAQEMYGEEEKIDYFTPQAKKEWRKQREVTIEAIRADTLKTYSEDAIRSRALGLIRSKLYGNERCYSADVIQKYVPASDLRSYDAFIAKEPTQDNANDVYVRERKKVEDKLLENDQITRKKDLLEELEQQYKLYEDREDAEAEDIRGNKYKGPYRKEYTTESLIKIGIYSLSRFDLTLKSRARFWEKDHKNFINKEAKNITRRNKFKADEVSEDELDGKVQVSYLEAGFIPNFMLDNKFVFSQEPQNWMSRKEFVEAYGQKLRRDFFSGRMRANFVSMNIGDGVELVPHEVAKAYREKKAEENREW